MKIPVPLTDDKITLTVPVRTNVAVHKAISTHAARGTPRHLCEQAALHGDESFC